MFTLKVFGDPHGWDGESLGKAATREDAERIALDNLKADGQRVEVYDKGNEQFGIVACYVRMQGEVATIVN